MITCKHALGFDPEDAGCEETMCCILCEKHTDCEFACENTPDECGEALTEEDALVLMKKNTGTVIKAIADLTLAKKKIEEQEKAMRVQLLEAMERYKVKKFDNDQIRFTYVAPTTRTTIDSAKLKKDLPEVAAKYTKTSKVSASVKIEVKS